MMDDSTEGDKSDQAPAAVSGQYVYPALDRVVFGPGCAETLPEELQRIHANRALLVTSRSLATKTPLAARITELLGPAHAGTFTGIRQHTPSQQVVELAGEAQRVRADVYVSLGGGSVIDAVKAAILAHARESGSVLPQIALPTTLSASEFSPLFGITDERSRIKRGNTSPHVVPRVAILDAELASYTPDWLWLGTGARAVDHAVETVYAPEHQPATDAPALEAIRMLFHYLPESKGRGSISARQQCQIASWLSFFGIANITLGLSHILGREIGARYDVPHGFTSSVLLPVVMSFLLPGTRDRQALIAQAAGVEQPEEAAGAVASLFERLSLPRRLRDLDVPEADLVALASGRQDVLHILREAW